MVIQAGKFRRETKQLLTKRAPISINLQSHWLREPRKNRLELAVNFGGQPVALVRTNLFLVL